MGQYWRPPGPWWGSPGGGPDYAAAAHTMMAATERVREAGLPLRAPGHQTSTGYEAAGHRFEWNLRLDVIRVKEHEATVRRLTEDDRPQVEAFYHETARTRDGHLVRGPYLWERVYKPLGETTRGYGVFGGDDLEGYLYLLHRDRVGGFYNLTLTDFLFKTPRAGRRLLALLADHASMAGEVRWFGGPADPAAHLLGEQKARAEFRFYWMLRITHLEAAWPRGVTPGLGAEIHLDIADDLVKAQHGRFVLHVQGGEGRCEKGGRGDIAADIRDLTALYSGHLTPQVLRAAGRVQGTDDALRQLGAVFAGTTPAMPDMF
jgi:predicted acetyltransferase